MKIIKNGAVKKWKKMIKPCNSTEIIFISLFLISLQSSCQTAKNSKYFKWGDIPSNYVIALPIKYEKLSLIKGNLETEYTKINEALFDSKIIYIDSNSKTLVQFQPLNYEGVKGLTEFYDGVLRAEEQDTLKAYILKTVFGNNPNLHCSSALFVSNEEFPIIRGFLINQHGNSIPFMLSWKLNNFLFSKKDFKSNKCAGMVILMLSSQSNTLPSNEEVVEVLYSVIYEYQNIQFLQREYEISQLRERLYRLRDGMSENDFNRLIDMMKKNVPDL